ncbi:MAG: caspase family protein, partial [Pseudomonadota bacterium]
MSLKLSLRVVAITLALLFAPYSQAKVMRALLVGVSEYPNLPQKLQLKGPRNDVVRARDVLMLRGFAQDNITLLADGVSGAALPTRSNILTALDQLAKSTAKDDLVFLYFAGHGSQQPADPQTAAGRAEPDGLYEIFLPRDVGKWSGSVGSVQNALVKTELRDVVDRILAKGAFVWGVFDTCHAATLVRGENDSVQYRFVNPQQLGVPQVAPNVAKPAADKSPFIAPSQTAQTGGSVFFYASQTREAAPEMILPKGQGDGRTFGLFSFTVMQALETGVPMSYRQMAQSILTRYGAMNETRVTPLFSGTALDQPVLFQQAPPVQQWKIERGSEVLVLAGALSQLSEGTILAVLANPLAKNDAAIGYLRLSQVSLAVSTALPTEFNNKPALQPEAIPPGSFARVVQNPPH